jgi:hypothetical protein
MRRGCGGGRREREREEEDDGLTNVRPGPF